MVPMISQIFTVSLLSVEILKSKAHAAQPGTLEDSYVNVLLPNVKK